MDAASLAVGSDVAGKRCNLRRPIRDRSGRSRFHEAPLIVREIFNLDRQMYLVRFADGATTFVFPDEVEVA
jgi:hypothetical protein